MPEALPPAHQASPRPEKIDVRGVVRGIGSGRSTAFAGHTALPPFPSYPGPPPGEGIGLLGHVAHALRQTSVELLLLHDTPPQHH